MASEHPPGKSALGVWVLLRVVRHPSGMVSSKMLVHLVDLSLRLHQQQQGQLHTDNPGWLWQLTTVAPLSQPKGISCETTG